jgi:hypothetical protein
MQRTVTTLLALAAALSSASAVSIETAHTRWYEAGDIRPITGYFGAALGGQRFRAVIASQPEQPAGQYFIVRLKDWQSAAIAGARMTLYASDSKEPAIREWEFGTRPLHNWLYLGLTGTDWPDAAVQPLAWRIELIDADGRVLAEWKSFLWEMP